MRRARVPLLVALTGPLLISLVWVPFRDSFDSTNAALVLVLMTAAVAVAGNRVAGVLTAVSAAVWFDLFLIRPYGRLSVTDPADVVSLTLLLAVGVGVTELAAWGHRQQASAQRDAADLAASRGELARLAEEQAALLRVATLVAAGTVPAELFPAVAVEVGQLLAVAGAAMARYEPNGTVIYVAAWGTAVTGFPVGSRWIPEGRNLTTMVFETGRPARIDDYADASGPLGVAARETGFRSAVATPITVEGRLWGVVVAGSSRELPLPTDTEARLANFTRLVATAIANVESRVELMASRARVVAASDESRRRIERDLHDGTQQRLVSLGMELRAVQAAAPPQLGELEGALSRVVGELASISDELREISRGIHPAVLSEGGLDAALSALRRRSAVPVELDLHTGRRLPEPVEVAAYYVVSEALTNAAKHAHATVVNVELDTQDTIMQLAIRDDGIGGAHPSKGSGLLGLSDRIEALGGSFQVISPTGDGTTLLIEVPLEEHSHALSPPQ